MLLEHTKHTETLAAVGAQVLVGLVGMLRQEVVPETTFGIMTPKCASQIK